MSRSPYFFVERFNSKLNKYERIAPLVWNYSHTEMEPADLFPYNGCHDLFSIVENGGDYPEMRGIHCGLPHDVSDEIKKEYDNCSYDSDDYFDTGKTERIEPSAHWFSYADMYIYGLENPTITDWDKYEDREDEDDHVKPTKPSPIFTLKKRVDAFMEVSDDWDWENDWSQIRIVYWIM